MTASDRAAELRGIPRELNERGTSTQKPNDTIAYAFANDGSDTAENALFLS